MINSTHDTDVKVGFSRMVIILQGYCTRPFGHKIEERVSLATGPNFTISGSPTKRGALFRSREVIL
jgi:hypothetical protein